MNDSEFMRQALDLAKNGLGLTSPNPPVGAVVVKDGEELGSGWHRAAGKAHAEIEALQDVSRRHGPLAAQDGTMYVTLEPCSTHGRTGPCTTALIDAGIKRVVIGSNDPNPAHCGRGGKLLREAGIEVVEGIEETRCEELIRAFSKVQRTGLPWVIIKSAFSLDGRITRPAGEGQWLSGLASREDVQVFRNEVDAVLSSGATVRADDPRFTLRGAHGKEGKRQPWRVILTSREEGVPSHSQVLRDSHADRTLIFKRQRIECVLRELASEHAVQSVLVEAGGRLVGRLLDEGWADEMICYLAPLVTGGPICASAGEGVVNLGGRLRMEGVRWQRFGSDVRLRGVLAGTGGELER